MAKNYKILLPAKSFKRFLKSLAKINPSVLINVKDYTMEVLSVQDQIVMLSTLKLPECAENDIQVTLPIYDINKLISICDACAYETLTLEVDDNVIKYSDDCVRLKFHMAEESIINVPKKVTPEKMRSFAIDFSSEVDRSKLQQLEKGFAFVKNSVTDMKIYFYVEDDVLYGELNDYTSSATDSFRVALSSSFKGSLSAKSPISYSMWALTDLPNSTVTIEASRKVTKGVVYNIFFIRQKTDELEYSYLITTLPA